MHAETASTERGRGIRYRRRRLARRPRCRVCILRREAMPRVDALADGVHDRVRDVRAAGLPVAAPVGQLHRGVLLPGRTSAGGLPADPSAFGERADDHVARQLLELRGLRVQAVAGPPARCSVPPARRRPVAGFAGSAGTRGCGHRRSRRTDRLDSRRAAGSTRPGRGVARTPAVLAGASRRCRD